MGRHYFVFKNEITALPEQGKEVLLLTYECLYAKVRFKNTTRKHAPQAKTSLYNSVFQEI